MGHYTHFALELEIPQHFEFDKYEIIAQLREFSEDARFTLEEDGSPSGEPLKWYSHADEFVEFSKLHPDVLFILNCDGIDAREVWKEYYKNGKSYEQEQERTFPAFDESLLV